MNPRGTLRRNTANYSTSPGSTSPRVTTRLKRYRHGPGISKVDFALDGPIPWAAEGCKRAGTVHLGGTLDEVAAGEGAVSRGAPRATVHPARPAEPLRPDARPRCKHTVWAYCHVPNGSTST